MNACNSPFVYGIAGFFKKAPLLVTESRRVTDAFFHAIAQTIGPTNDVRVATGDYVDLEWEIRRLRRAKADIINATRLEAFRTVFGSDSP